MDLKLFDESIYKLFGKDLLKEFNDDYGYTYKAERPIGKIGYATNLSIETIEEAVKQGADLMITHHDAWDFIYGLREACLAKLQEHGISSFWIHGPLDFVSFGTCTSLMDILDINRIIQYSFYENGDIPGIGEFDESIEFDTLVKRMCVKLEEPVRFWRNSEKKVRRVGVLTGAGHSTNHLKYAVENGCDTYITGEATLYSIQYAQFAGLNLIAGSHTFTEIFGVASLAGKLKEIDQNIEVVKLKETHFEHNR